MVYLHTPAAVRGGKYQKQYLSYTHIYRCVYNLHHSVLFPIIYKVEGKIDHHTISKEGQLTCLNRSKLFYLFMFAVQAQVLLLNPSNDFLVFTVQ